MHVKPLTKAFRTTEGPVICHYYRNSTGFQSNRIVLNKACPNPSDAENIYDAVDRLQDEIDRIQSAGPDGDTRAGRLDTHCRTLLAIIRELDQQHVEYANKDDASIPSLSPEQRQAYNQIRTDVL